MHALQLWAIANWPRHRQKVMYLVVGGWNSTVAYGRFALLYYLLHERLTPSLILGIAYAVASVNGFVMFRRVVFRSVRHPLIEYIRYQLVYLPILAVNMVALPLALALTGLNAYVIQGLLAVFVVVAAYLGNKYFTFRKP